MSPIDTVLRALAGKRFPCEVEKACQAAIGDALTAAGLAFSREDMLDSGIIDFVVFVPQDGTVHRVGIEVKIKGARTAIWRQIVRYSQDDALDALILATLPPVYLPGEINGKPAASFSIGSAWL